MIHVTPLSRLAETVRATGATHVLTLLSEGSEFERPGHLVPANCLHLTMHDIVDEQDGFTPPSRAHVEALIDFARGWDREKPLVVHCYAGISRSTAAAYVIAAALDPARDERELAQALRAASRTATPNARIVALADDILGRDGRMIAAIAEIGIGADAFEGTPFTIEV